MRLPFPLRPPVQAYLHHAYTTGIMEAIGYRWALVNEYLNLEVRVNDGYSGVALFMDISPWTDLAAFEREGFCSTTVRSAEEIVPLSSGELAGQLRALIFQGRYAEVYVDEYFIPPSAHFGRTHRNHAMLVIGCDDDASEFSVMSYRNEGRFSASEIPAGALCQAIAMQPRLNAPYTADKALREIAQGPISSEPCLNLARIRGGLADFLAPRNSLPFEESWLDGVEPGTAGFVYGRFCYDLVEADIRYASERNRPIDVRLTRLIWERSKIAVERAVKLAELGIVSDAPVDEWVQVAEGFHRVHLMAFQHNLDRQRRRGVPRADAQALLCDVAMRECDLTERLLLRLERL